MGRLTEGFLRHRFGGFIFGVGGLYLDELIFGILRLFLRQPISTDFRSSYLKSPVLENVFSYTVHSLSAICR